LKQPQLVTLTAVVRKAEDVYVALCPEVSTVSQGNTVDEAVANLQEATRLYLQDDTQEIETLEDDIPIVNFFQVSRANTLPEIDN